MKLVKTEIKAEIYGTEYILRKPNLLEINEYRNSLIKLEESSDASEVMKNFLFKMGLPKEVFDVLEVAHVAEIMDAVTESKKK